MTSLRDQVELQLIWQFDDLAGHHKLNISIVDEEHRIFSLLVLGMSDHSAIPHIIVLVVAQDDFVHSVEMCNYG